MPGTHLTPDVIVVGGGQAGLVAAYELQERGLAVHLFEAAPRLGGRIATARYDGGLWAERGMHELWSADPVTEYATRFGLPLSPPQPAWSSVELEGRLHVLDGSPWPASLFTEEEKHGLEQWFAYCRLLLDEARSIGLTANTRPLQEVSFTEWLAACLLPRRVAEWIRLCVECEVAVDAGAVSALYALQQLRIFLDGETCRHVEGGNQALVDAFAQRLRGPVTLGARVLRVVRERDEDGHTRCAVEYLSDGVLHLARAPLVVTAVPYHALRSIEFHPSLTPAQWAAVHTLRAGRYTVVHLVLEAAAAPMLHVDGHWPFPLLTSGPLGAIYGAAHPPADGEPRFVFTLLLHGERAGVETEEAARERLLPALEVLWPGLAAHVAEVNVHPHAPAATPAWPPGRSPYDTLAESLREENLGLFLAGDYVYGSHADAAVTSGREAAARVAAHAHRRNGQP